MAGSTSGRRASLASRSSRPTRHTSSSPRGHAGTKKSQPDIIVPDVDEIRQLRQAYFDHPSKAGNSILASNLSKSSTSIKAETKQTRKKESSMRSRPSISKPTRKQPRTRPSKKTATSTEDYVYGTAAPVQVIIEEETESDVSIAKDRIHPEGRRAAVRKTPRKRKQQKMKSLISNVELTPDDSISQVAMRPYRLRPAKRTSLASVPERSSAEIVADQIAKSKRTSVSLGSIFSRRSMSSAPAKKVECLTCGSEVQSTKTAKLECGHQMCHSCLKRIFKLAVQDPAHMPPKCCTVQHIPLRHVDSLFDFKFKVLFNRKFDEYKTKNRIYCPNSRCGVWIRPAYFHNSGGRRYAQCNKCKTRACLQCGMKLHKAKECPKDPEIAKLVEQAEKEGWKRCYSCNAMVELKEGCNHMTCRCLAEFCMVCGSKWKTCDCPWFNNAQIADADRLLNMRVPEPFQVLYRHVFADPGALADAQTNQQPPHPGTYREELAQRRRQERQDADLAQRMQWASLLDDESISDTRQHQDTWGIGNAAGHHMNDNHVFQPTGIRIYRPGDADMGKRGERESSRRKASRLSARADPGLVPNFLGEPSVLDAGQPSSRNHDIYV